jgi:predicted nucleic acid-binding protein
MEKVLIDSDVILDVFFDRHPFANFSAEILRRCEIQEIQGFITPVILSNIYYVLSRVSTHAKIVEKLKQLLLILEIVPMNKGVILEALNSKFKDFEDALQNYAAIDQGDIHIILTRNIKDYQKSTLAVLSPEMYLRD